MQNKYIQPCSWFELHFTALPTPNSIQNHHIFQQTVYYYLNEVLKVILQFIINSMLVQKTVNLSKVIKYIKVVLNTYYLKNFLNQFNSHFVTTNKIRRNEIYYVGMPFISWSRLLYCGNFFFRGHNFYFVAMTFILWKQILFRYHDFYFVAKNLIKKSSSIFRIAATASLWILHRIVYFYQGTYKTFGLLLWVCLEVGWTKITVNKTPTKFFWISFNVK